MKRLVLMVITAFICGMVLSGCNNATNDNTDLSVDEPDLTNAIVKFAEVRPGCMPYEVKFVNVSNVGVDVSYFWDFGDGTTSDEREPIHTFMETGVYCVTLTVSFYDGKEMELNFTERVIVYPLPVIEESTEFIADFEVFDVSSSCNPNEVMFINKSQNFAALHWDFGDGFVTSEIEPIHLFLKAGSYNVTLTVFNEDGSSSISITKTVVIDKEISVIDNE